MRLPSLRTGRADLPHPALRSMVHLKEDRRNRVMEESSLFHHSKDPSPCERAFSCGQVPRQCSSTGISVGLAIRLRHPCIEPAGKPQALRSRIVSFLPSEHSISLEPFAPPALPGFVATMAPLTPVRRLFVPVGSRGNSAREHLLDPDRSLCFMSLAFRPFRLQPPTAPRHRFHTLRSA